MKTFVRFAKMFLGFVFASPHLVLFHLSGNKKIIQADIKRWLEIHNESFGFSTGLIFLLSHLPEFRNLFYYRIGAPKYLLNIWYPKIRSLVINAETVGDGLYLQHAHSTRIGAKTVGKNCWINQNVTIGWEQKGQPVILDNVRIGAGARVIGKVVVGNNVVIGANAVIVKNVPDNCTVVGVYPVYIVKRNGQKVKEIL